MCLVVPWGSLSVLILEVLSDRHKLISAIQCLEVAIPVHLPQPGRRNMLWACHNDLKTKTMSCFSVNDTHSFKPCDISSIVKCRIMIIMLHLHCFFFLFSCAQTPILRTCNGSWLWKSSSHCLKLLLPCWENTPTLLLRVVRFICYKANYQRQS